MTIQGTWLLVGGAVIAEVSAALLLRYSEGFRRFLPTLAALGAFGAAFYLVSLALTVLPVSSVYPVWAGGGTSGVAVAGILLLGERRHLFKLIGVTSVVVGVVLINIAAAGGA